MKNFLIIKFLLFYISILAISNIKFTNKNLNVIIRKTKIEIDNENYKYLQFIDLIENKDNIYVEVDNMDEIIYNFIEENELQFEKILKYRSGL